MVTIKDSISRKNRKANKFHNFRSFFIAALLVVAALVPRASHAEEIEILRDTYGIPHVFAKTTGGAYYGAGWSYAEDDGFQFILEILSARGQVSEFIHPDSPELDTGLIEGDIQSRGFQYYELAADWEKMPLDVKSALGAFADGFNDYMDHILKSGKLQDRFGIYEGLKTADIIEKVGHITERDLVALAIGLNVQDALSNISESEQSLLKQDAAASQSNAAAIAANLNDYRKPLLYGDLHNEWDGALHIAHLSAPGLNIVAFFNGPYAMNGRGNNLAIAFTRNQPDGVDIYREEIDPKRPGYYRIENDWMPMTRKDVRVKVRGHDDLNVTLYYTRHGWAWDYQSLAGKSNIVHSIRIAVLDNNGEAAAPYRFAIQLMRTFWADSIATFYNIVREPFGAQRSFVLADDRYNIAYLWYGRVPVRITDVNPRYSIKYDVPLDGWNTLNDWLDGVWMPGDPIFQLPFFLNPRGGNVRSANDAPWNSNGCDAPQRRPAWIPGHVVPELLDTTTRGNLLGGILCARKIQTIEDMHDQLAFNTYCPTADAFIKAIRAGWRANEEALKQIDIPENVRTLDNILTNWNARADIDQAGMSVMFHLRRITRLPRFSENYTPTLVEMNAYLNDLAVVADTMMDLYGRLDVPWGEIHVLIYAGREFPAPGGTPNIQSLLISSMGYNMYFNSAAKPDLMYGDLPEHTEAKYRGKILCSFGSSFIHAHIMDQQNPVSYMIAPQGQFDPAFFLDSKHLFQQIEMFANKQWMRMPMSRKEVEASLCPWGNEPGHEHPATTRLEFGGHQP